MTTSSAIFVNTNNMRERLASALVRLVEIASSPTPHVLEEARLAVENLGKEAPVDAALRRIEALEAQVRSLQSELSMRKLSAQKGF